MLPSVSALRAGSFFSDVHISGSIYETKQGFGRQDQHLVPQGCRFLVVTAEEIKIILYYYLYTISYSKSTGNSGAHARESVVRVCRAHRPRACVGGSVWRAGRARIKACGGGVARRG